MSTGLYIGRFQPFHLGHLSAIQQALLKTNRLYIGIGSSQYHHTAENPFTAEERETMLRLGLEEAGLLERCEIFKIPDIHDAEKWVAHVQSLVPPFDVVVVGNEGLVKTLFEKAQIPVHMVEREHDISATQVRHLIQKKGSWQEMLSPAIATYLSSRLG